MKIDKSFVMNMIEDGGDAAIVRASVELGHALGLTVVAEGVEDTATLGVLADLGCDRAQGYLISRPLPADAFAEWVHQRSSAGTRTTAPSSVDGAVLAG
jgi:diguanylate cyclase